MRAQTTIDFAIGMAIFLGIMVFAFSFVPGILQPFELTDDEGPALSDRMADSLSQDHLGSTEHPHVLDRYCAVAYFDEDADASDSCNYDSDDIHEQFNLQSYQNVNVSLEGNVTGEGTEQLCWAENAPDEEPALVESGHSSCDSDDVKLAKGDDVPDEQGTTITARRVVSLEDESVILEVTLW